MIVSAFECTGKEILAQKYPEHIIYLNVNDFKNRSQEKNKTNLNYPLNYLDAVKQSIKKYKLVIVDQHTEIRKCLNAIKLDYILVYPDMSLKEEYITRCKELNRPDSFIKYFSAVWTNWIQDLKSDKIHKSIILTEGQVLEDCLKDFDLADLIIEPKDGDTATQGEQKAEDKQESVEIVDNIVHNLPALDNKDISIGDVLDGNIIMDDLMMRDLKIMENKIRAGMLVQAKLNLSRVDKLMGVMNKIQDELFDRIEDNLENIKNDKLVEYISIISNLIRDTNSMVMSIIVNPKFQNLFIVDNSNNVTVEDTSGFDVNKRKRIRHAVQVVLENIDKVEEGNLQDLQNPNEENKIKN